MKKYSIYALAVALATLLVITGCDSQLTENSETTDNQTLAYQGSMDANSDQSDFIEFSIEEIMNSLNDKLAAEGLNYRVRMAEYITAEGSGEAGNTVFAKDVGNKQLGTDFVPNDARRTWSNPGAPGDTDDITYAIDQTPGPAGSTPFLGGLSGTDATAAIQRAMGTWDAQTCSDLSLTEISTGIDISATLFFFSGGFIGNPTVVADIQHAGFNVNWGNNILGVAFSFVFVGPNGPTDVDNNGKTDKAFTEIYYGPFFPWADDGTNPDLETVALHEAGHGLSQAHFGQIFVTKSGKFKVAPLAVMNAGYTQVQRDLKGTDKGGHCSNWAEWPNN
ncbi:hypothetical protein [Rhodohalobacter sulfatireducens]|uniref:Peptidase M10 metallopeptidase domain-containing protein n=1 Tax=Rhodohalobacter sulfatireducens TaxID=2911366 RepID=A0ABS9KAN1_9BACT|nr:hypothetical protein [Rhodohalobacter sulfatireducens]MCG2587907.1 hypothetical protein [Rhodohalobacter sulfatireducens]